MKRKNSASAIGDCRSVRFLFAEPFFGGSHQDFAENLAKYSRHEIELMTLPARFWKWRMRGAALYFHHHIKNLKKYDGLITSPLMSLADFKGLAGPSAPPSLVYFHENQFSYPLAPGESPDFQFGFTNISTALSADKLLFNSRTHLEAFFKGMRKFIRMMPDTRPNWIFDKIQEKSSVLYPGCAFPGGNISLRPLKKEAPPLIVWNHRWEFDKNPEAFFSALAEIKARGLKFRLAILGENFSKIPPVFETAKTRFADEILHYGYLPSKAEYYKMLQKGAIIISTAIQENFGISVCEAVRFGCLPLLPNRLSYPEILPKEFHNEFIFQSDAELADKLADLIFRYQELEGKREKMSEAMGRFAWENVIGEYDLVLEGLGDSSKSD